MSKHKTRQINRITEATFQLIHDEGLSRLSISKVAEVAGVTRQTVYNYFPDVESIIAQAVDAHSKAMEQHLIEVMDAADGPFDKLRAFAEFQISIASPEHENVSLEAGLSSESRNRIAEHMDAVKTALGQVIEVGIRGGVLSKDVDPATASELIWGMVESAANAAIKHPNQKPYLLDAVAKAMWAALTD